MREKGCTICKETFTYKNKSKQYCSNACKQQALRNRHKAKLKQDGHHTNGWKEDKNNALIIRLTKNCIKQIEAMCAGMSIHYKTIIFLKDTVQALKVNAPESSTVRKQLERLKGVMTTLHKYSTHNQCEYGYCCFDQSTSDKTLSSLKHVKRRLHDTL